MEIEITVRKAKRTLNNCGSGCSGCGCGGSGSCSHVVPTVRK